MAQKSQSTGTSARGFASMDPSKQREIASKGGQSVPAAKRSFSQNRQLAAEAGRKGGQSSHGGGRRQGGDEGGRDQAAASNAAGDQQQREPASADEREKVESH